MKIAYLSVFYPYRGGIAQFNEQLYAAFEEKHSVKAFNFSLQYPKVLFPGKSQLVDNPKDNHFDSDRTLNSINPFSYRSTVKAIRAYDPDVLIVGYWMPFVGPSLGYVAGKLKKSVKVISIVHNAIPHEKKIIDKPFTNYFLKRSNAFVALSSAVKRDIIELQSNSKVLEVKHPVYAQFEKNITLSKARKSLKISEEKKVILFFGLIRDYKGLDLLINSMALLDDSYVLVIAGEVYGDDTQYINLIAELELSDRIIFHNKFIKDEDVATYFMASDVCVLPYKTATQSGITAIANHFNLPQIVTDVGGLKETIIPGKTGLVVENRTAENLAEKIKMYFNQDLKQTMAEAIEVEKKENSWENMANQIISFAKSL